MAPAATYLSVDEFERRWGHEAGWEYWFGEARLKPMPTHLHGLLAILLADLLRLAGYVASVESELRISPDWRPRPDVYGVLGTIRGRYATEPVDVIFEVLSEGEDIVSKCRHYTEIKIPQIFVFDPEVRSIALWRNDCAFEPVIDVKLGNGVIITGATIWTELGKRQSQEPPKSKIL